MKKNLIFVFGLCAAILFTGCKSRESAYKQAYEQAIMQDKTNQTEQQVVTPAPETTTTVATPVTPTQTVPVDHSDVREIQGDLSVISGNPLKTYSVVVGSFVTQANAEAQKSTLASQGHDSRVVKTNETINGHTGWFRVIASSYDDKASAVESRDGLKSSFPGAWLLYRK